MIEAVEGRVHEAVEYAFVYFTASDAKRSILGVVFL
jgi:hypothetical protein